MNRSAVLTQTRPTGGSESRRRIWELLRYYSTAQFREPFWRWARELLRFSCELTYVFEFCCTQTDVSTVMEKLAVSDPAPARVWLQYMKQQKQLDRAIPVAATLVRVGNPEKDLRSIQTVLTHALTNGRKAEAMDLQRLLVEQGWVDGSMEPAAMNARPL